MKKPHYLVQDSDGHWYLIPESFRERFEAILNMDGEAPSRDLNKLVGYSIDRPDQVRITDWEILP